MSGRILIVDDDIEMCQMIATDLKYRELESSFCTSAKKAWETLKNEEVAMVLTDLNMPDMSGTDLCKRIVDSRPDIPVVVITSFGSLETAIQAIRAGAFDFVTKPIELEVLSIVLKRALNHRGLQEKIKVLNQTLEQHTHYEELLGESLPMQALYDRISRAAISDASILITGESGTGKELVARALHKKSQRQKGSFVGINCAVLPDTLLESELFGHVRGAFTDARSDRKGLLCQAHGGTLFFDEIGDLPLKLQPKLLRALEERTVRPMGSNKEIPFDVRIFAATNRDLETAVEGGTFREDLYYRINVIPFKLPPLRARGNDILLLAQSFLQDLASRSSKQVVGISTPVIRKLLDYEWPGNVRELRNTIERAVALTRFDKIVVEDLPEKIRAYRSSQFFFGGEDPGELISMDDLEKRYIQHVIKTVGGNRTQAAKILGLDRKTLYRKLPKI